MRFTCKCREMREKKLIYYCHIKTGVKFYYSGYTSISYNMQININNLQFTDKQYLINKALCRT
jgi:hypothetical protein